MKRASICFALCTALLCGCSGGGGGTTTSPVPAWGKFRHDLNNTGQGPADLAGSRGFVGAVTIDALPPPSSTPPATPATGSAIVASPAIALDGTVYIASSGGTLAAVNPSDLTVKWRRTSCEICAAPTPQATPGTALADAQELGPLLSSPAVYSVNGVTSVMIGSSAHRDATGTLRSGGFFVFEDTGNGQPTCAVCFRPNVLDPLAAPASFLGSPTFTINLANFNGLFRPIDGIFFGSDAGVFYVIGPDGSLKWRFPRSGTIGAITSSPAFGQGNTVYFTAADNLLYALVTTDGALKWTFPVAAPMSAPFGTTPLASLVTYAAADDGSIVAINPDGTFAFSTAPRPGDEILGALALGSLQELTPTPASGPTPTPLTNPELAVAVTRSGSVIAIPAAAPTPTVFPPATPIPAPVLSSPAVSVDLFVVFGANDGKLYGINMGTGEAPSAEWPVQLMSPPVPIRSSPAIADDGTVFIGADDGKLYVVRP